jgi:hypothetical protein
VTERARLALFQAAAAALVLAPALIITWAFRPGYMNADSLIAYSVTKPWGDFADWRAPLIEKLWDAFETAGVGSPTIVLFAQTLTMVAGFYLVMRAVLGRVAAGAVAAGLVFTPLVLSQVMLIGRDTWLTSFVVFQVGCAIRWSGATGRSRRVWLGLTLLAGMFVIATRQNAIVLEFFVLFCVAYRAYARRSPGQGRVRAVLLSVAVGGAACVLGFAVVSTLPRLMGARDVRPEAQLYAYDLTGMSLREDDVLLGPEAFPSQDLDVLRERWDSSSVLPVILPLGEGPILVDERFPEAIEELGDDWRREVRARPAAYLAVRWEMFQRILGVSHPSTYVLHPGIDGNPWGFAIANHDANDAFRDYLGLFSADDSFVIGSNLFRPVIWLGLGLVAAGALLIPRRFRARPGGLEMGLLVVGAVLYEGTFFFLAMGEAYRYSYPLIVVSILTLVFAVATLVRYRASATTDEGDLETSDDDDSTPDVGGAPGRSGHRADDSPPSPAYAPPATERAITNR